MLPFALSLPAGWALAAVVIGAQSLVELLSMVFLLGWAPRHLRLGTMALRASGRASSALRW